MERLMKTCSKCSQTKPLAEYYKSKACPDGYTYYCIACAYPTQSIEKKEYIKNKIAAERQDDPVKFLLAAAKCRAKKEGVPFNLTKEDLQIPMYCPVFGMELTYGGTGVSKRGYGASPSAASIDRVDGKKGYIKGNINVISWKANRAKCQLSVKELVKLAEYFSWVVEN
jgi:hypothetical protein